MNHSRHISRQLSLVRNIGIAAHVDAGKTTLTERILFYTGALHKIGEVHEGAAHMDWLAEEQAHGITIGSAVTQAPWRNHMLQVVDTPGHVDFTIEVERSMRVLDGVVVVLDGVRGVEPQTETVWRQRTRFGLPTLFFINKMDRPGADFNRALAALRARLGVRPVAVTVPLPELDTVIDLLDRRLLRFAGARGERVEAVPCPDEVWRQWAQTREELLLAAAEADDTLADLVLASDNPIGEITGPAGTGKSMAGRAVTDKHGAIRVAQRIVARRRLGQAGQHRGGRPERVRGENVHGELSGERGQPLADPLQQDAAAGQGAVVVQHQVFQLETAVSRDGDFDHHSLTVRRAR